MQPATYIASHCLPDSVGGMIVRQFGDADIAGKTDLLPFNSHRYG